MERDDSLVIYPEYFDYRLSRRLGRKLALKYCLKDPKLEEIIESVRKLKLPLVVEEDKHHPANWFERKGRIRVFLPNKKYKKRIVLKAIAKNLKEVRKKLLQKKLIGEKKAKKGKSGDIDKFIERTLKGKKKK
ncbi:MAG: signal recognition particle subunit SRP19/SEC65 family protein [Candidatus Njordarchaeia archaeon]